MNISNLVLKNYLKKSFIPLLGLVVIMVSTVGSAYAKVFIGNPGTYESLLGNLQAGDILQLEAGIYRNRLPLSNLEGEPGKPIIITGPESGEPAIILGEACCNTVQIENSSYLTIQHIKLDGLDIKYIDAVNARGITHHITLDSLEIVRHGAAQLTNGIATRGPAWGWVVRNCKIIGAGTGIYFGNSTGEDWPFVGGLIEHNLFVDTVGYNMQIKHMRSRSYASGNSVPGMPLEKRKTIIRHNVFSKANQPTPPEEGSRPNLLVGHFPLSGPGSDDVYEIYGNFFYQNTTEALFQGEGNIAMYDNVFVNASGSAVNIQPHNDVPRNINVFHNTIVAKGSGISVTGVNTNFSQRVVGNAVFAGTPVSVNEQNEQVVQQDNVTAAYASASDYLLNPDGDIDSGALDLFPQAGVLLGEAIDMTAFQSFSDWERDFNGDLRTGGFRGAYVGDTNNNGWVLAVDIKSPEALTPTPPAIMVQPEGVTVMEGENVTFNIAVTGSATLTYQWFRNGASIADATNARYTIMATTPADNATYNVDVTNDFGSISSNGAVLTVLADTQAPTLVSAVAVSETRVGIRFSEAVSPGSAETISNYQLSLGITVTNASLSDDGRTISLTLSELTPDTDYTVSVSSVQDLAQTPNTIAAQSSINFTYRSADGFEDGNADGWTPLTESRWEVVLDEGNYVYWLNTTAFSQGLERQLGEYSLLSGAYGDFTFTARARLGDDVDSNALADYAVVFGFQDEDNYYFVMFNNQQGATQLLKFENGIRTALATAAAGLNDNDYHSIEVRRAGSVISVFFDGALMLSGNDDSLGAGQVGVGSYNDSAYFDDVSVGGVASTTPDTTPPVITLMGVDPQEITIGGTYAELGATAVDNMDDDISSIVIDATAVDTATIGNYSVTYNVMDATGNAATQVVRTVNVTAAASDNSAADNSGSSSVASDNSGGGTTGLLSSFFLLLILVLRTCCHRIRRACDVGTRYTPRISFSLIKKGPCYYE
ncbi:MAG: DUF5011 domain-containing protein [Gammaproteobacteria bacterium]|nr:DUF5011 domain-containing protein [Gammaproteobacteria bacterium]